MVRNDTMLYTFRGCQKGCQGVWLKAVGNLVNTRDKWPEQISVTTRSRCPDEQEILTEYV